MIDLSPLGERGFLAKFADDDQARGWHQAVHAQSLPGIIDLVLAYNVVAVHADPDRVNLDELEPMLATISAICMSESDGPIVRVPVLYDGEDLGHVAEKTGLSREEIIAAHSGQEYRVKAIGFLPGFPYCGDLPSELSGLARRSSPRTRVPAGSVAIVGRQTGIYPAESPGGWHLIGRTPLVIADLDAEFFPIHPGDRIRFEPILESEYQSRFGESLTAVTRMSSGRKIGNPLQC